jgi:peptidoglycan/xylan/chitin deacetylase (PgdA/CDA1 family)
MILSSLLTLGILNGKAAQSTPVLTYHDVIPFRDSKSLWFDCTLAEFKDQIAFFRKKKAVFISIEHLRLGLEGRRSIPPNAVCLTFADNYFGFYKYAWPILRKEKIPVTQFVHTDFVGSAIGRPKMSWRQLIELDRSSLVTVASQTCSHPGDLTQLSDDQINHELVNSKRLLEQKLGHPVSAIAYPNGKYDLRIATAASKAGYKIGFTEVTQPAQRKPDMFRVPRYVHTKYLRAWRDCFGKS